MNVLLITNKADITTDFIVRELTLRRILFYRLNTEEIGVSVQIELDILRKIFIIKDNSTRRTIDLMTVDSVYYRRPEINTDFGGVTLAEANFLKSELLYTLEGLYKILRNAFWLNGVDAIRIAENKVYQLLLATETGFKIPESIITNLPAAAWGFYETNGRSCIIKPVKSGLVEADSEEGVIFTSEVHLDIHNMERVSLCPVYLQGLIKKKADIRVTVVGQQVFPAMIISQLSEESRVDWRKSVAPLEHRLFELPEDIEQKCIALTSRLNLNFSAIDLVLDTEGQFYFLEINPNGQWAWIEKRLNYPISKAITNLLIEKAD